MTKTMYIDDMKIGEIKNLTYHTHHGNEQPIVEIPAGDTSVVTTFNVKDPEEVRRFMEVFMSIVPLTDAEIMKEFLDESGEITQHAMNCLNVVSISYVNNGKLIEPALMVFKDGSHLVWR